MKIDIWSAKTAAMPAGGERQRDLLDGEWHRGNLRPEKLAKMRAKTEARMGRLIGAKVQRNKGGVGTIVSFRFFGYIAAQPSVEVRYKNGLKEFLKESDFVVLSKD
jgi:hypothetical protein